HIVCTRGDQNTPDADSFPTRRSSDLDWTAVLDTFDASSSTVKGQVRLVNPTDATAWMTFDLTSRTTHSGYREFALTTTGSSRASSEEHTYALQSHLNLVCRLAHEEST